MFDKKKKNYYWRDYLRRNLPALAAQLARVID